jgi:hypothetical protein
MFALAWLRCRCACPERCRPLIVAIDDDLREGVEASLVETIADWQAAKMVNHPLCAVWLLMLGDMQLATFLP